jgi:hypothetical protein
MSLNWTEINKEITVFKKCIFLVFASEKLCIPKLSGTGGNGAYLSEYPRDSIPNCSDDWARLKGTATLSGDRSGAQSGPLKNWGPTRRWAVIILNLHRKHPTTSTQHHLHMHSSPETNERTGMMNNFFCYSRQPTFHHLPGDPVLPFKMVSPSSHSVQSFVQLDLPRMTVLARAIRNLPDRLSPFLLNGSCLKWPSYSSLYFLLCFTCNSLIPGCQFWSKYPGNLASLYPKSNLRRRQIAFKRLTCQASMSGLSFITSPLL